MQNRQLSLFLDFDGTLTAKAGSATVYSPFFSNLIAAGSKEEYKYVTVPLQPIDKMSVLMKEHKEFKTYRMLEEAQKFLIKMEERNALITIISKNREDYIKAMLYAVGFTKQQIDKIHIYGIDNLKLNKKGIVEHCLQNQSLQGYAVILDDDCGDRVSMIEGMQLSPIDQEKFLIGIEQNPDGRAGGFDFAELLNEINRKNPVKLTTEVAANVSDVSFLCHKVAMLNISDEDNENSALKKGLNGGK